jgi:hypothetical protein
MNVFEQGPFDQDAPEVYIRCLLCGETMEKLEFDFHECDVIPWEEI